MVVARGPPRPRGVPAASRLLLRSTLPAQRPPALPGAQGRGGPGRAAAGPGRGHAQRSHGKFIKHLKWIIIRLMDQVMERNYTPKCGDEKKEKGIRRRVVTRSCEL